MRTRFAPARRPPRSGESTPRAVSPVVVALEAAAIGLVVALAGLGASLASGSAGWTRVAHARAADALVVVALVLALASFVSGVHRSRPVRWWLHGVLLLGSAAQYVLGHASVASLDGLAGRAHIAEALGVPAGIDAVRLAHLSAGALLSVCALGLALPLAREASRAWRATLTSVGLAAVSVAALTVLAPLPVPLPESVGAAVGPPWPALALVPLEDAFGVRSALGAVAVFALACAAMPFVDRATRAPWVRRATGAALGLAFILVVSLLAFGSLSGSAFGHSWR